MARIRYIKPSIMTNEDLAELGPYAYILFTGLWMLADREGRLEYRPKRIKAIVCPLWDAVTVEILEDLVRGLCEKHMLRVYDCAGQTYLQITNWRKHQYTDPREAKSDIPAPPPVNGVATADGSMTSEDTQELHSKDSESSEKNLSDSGFWILDKESESQNSGGVGVGGFGGKRKTPPPPKNGTRTHAPAARKKQPARAEQPTARPQPKPPRRPPQPQPRQSHAPGEVETVRQSLNELAPMLHMPPPDDAIIRQVLDAGQGARADDIHATLVELWKRQKFRAMYSWGFVPLVLRDCYSAHSRAATA